MQADKSSVLDYAVHVRHESVHVRVGRVVNNMDSYTSQKHYSRSRTIPRVKITAVS